MGGGETAAFSPPVTSTVSPVDAFTHHAANITINMLLKCHLSPGLMVDFSQIS